MLDRLCTKPNEMKYFIIIFWSSLIISCKNNSNKTDLSSNTLIRDNFTKAEIIELNKILNYFEDSVLVNKSPNLEDAYLKYLNIIIDAIDNNDTNVDLVLNFDQGRLIYLIENIDTKLFNEIWMRNRIKEPLTQADTIGYWMINRNGKYVKLLESYIKSDTIIKEYFNYIYSYWEIPLFPGNEEYFATCDLNNEITRLIIAVHYISWYSYINIKKYSSVHNKVYKK
jgi:hypothetical protein